MYANFEKYWCDILGKNILKCSNKILKFKKMHTE